MLLLAFQLQEVHLVVAVDQVPFPEVQVEEVAHPVDRPFQAMEEVGVAPLDQLVPFQASEVVVEAVDHLEAPKPCQASEVEEGESIRAKVEVVVGHPSPFQGAVAEVEDQAFLDLVEAEVRNGNQVREAVAAEGAMLVSEMTFGQEDVICQE